MKKLKKIVTGGEKVTKMQSESDLKLEEKMLEMEEQGQRVVTLLCD